MKNIILAVVLSSLTSAHGAELIHEYTFNQNYKDSVGNLDVIGNGGVVTAGRYVFDVNQGLTLVDALPDSSTYTIEMNLQVDSIEIGSAYKKLVDFQNLQSDTGLYFLQGALNFYSGLGSGADTVASSTDAVVVITRQVDGETASYLNGQLQFTLPNEVSQPVENILQFFIDDLATSQIESWAGSIDYLRVYDAALTAEEVAALINTDQEVTSRDLFEVGDGLISYDPMTDSEWLDLNQTLGLSVDDINAGVGDWLSEGFRVATRAEVEQLWGSFGFVDFQQQTPANTQAAASYIDLMSCTFNCFGSFYRRATGIAQGSGTQVHIGGVDLVLGLDPNEGRVGFNGVANTGHSNFSSSIFVVRDAQPLDSDFDNVVDSLDNCTTVSNVDQRDTDEDGFGNACDPDLNNDGVVNFADVSLWAPFFNTANDGDADFNGDGSANFADYALYSEYFLQAPGPSGLAN